jgi:pimeloyl-ACP methyl ester carboxylesterase
MPFLHKLRIPGSLAAAALLASCAGPHPTDQANADALPILFVHGNGDNAALWQTTIWRFESNGWPRGRLHAVNLPYPLARDEDAKPQPGRSSTAESRDALAREVDAVLRESGKDKVILIGNSRGGYAIRNYVQTMTQQHGAAPVAAAVLGGTPNHGVWSIPGYKEGSEFSGTGAFLRMLNAPKNAAGDEVAGPVRWMTIRSDDNDKYAQPDSAWPKGGGKPTGVTLAGPALQGADNVVIPGIDHRETSYSEPAFEATWRFLTGKPPARRDIVSEESVRLSGMVTGLGADPLDAASGNYADNLPLRGAVLEVYPVRPAGSPDAGSRTGPALLRQTIGADGRWGPVAARPGTPYEFVIAAPGYATTHVYRSGFPRSSEVVMLRPERIADSDRKAREIVLLTRPRGYLDAGRDRMRFDGREPPGLPPRGGVLATSKLLLQEDAARTVEAEFNGERIAGRTWNAGEGHVGVLEITR